MAKVGVIRCQEQSNDVQGGVVLQRCEIEKVLSKFMIT